MKSKIFFKFMLKVVLVEKHNEEFDCGICLETTNMVS